MSYAISNDRKDKLPEIEMPPLPEQQPEIQEQEQVEVQAAPEPEVIEEVVEVKPQPKASAPSESFKQLRDKAERAERERDELLRRFQEMDQRAAPQKQTAPAEEDDFSINPDELVEGKHLRSYDKKIKKLEDQLRNYQQQSVQSSIESQINSKYPDFSKVVTEENIAILKTEYPEIAETLSSSNNLFAKASSTYTMMKKLGIHVEDNFLQEKALVQKNAAKPKPSVIVSPQQGPNPITRANAFENGLTDDLRAQLLKEMNAVRKGY